MFDSSLNDSKTHLLQRTSSRFKKVDTMDNTEFASIFKVPRQSFGKVSIALMETKYLSNTSKIRKRYIDWAVGTAVVSSFLSQTVELHTNEYLNEFDKYQIISST